MIEPRGQSRTVRRRPPWGRRPSDGPWGDEAPGSPALEPSARGGEVRPVAAGAARPRGGLRRDAREVRTQEPETRKTASGGYPGRSSNSAPDEGDGTRTARGIPPAGRSRADRAQTRTQRTQRGQGEQRACGRRACPWNRREDKVYQPANPGDLAQRTLAGSRTGTSNEARSAFPPRCSEGRESQDVHRSPLLRASRSPWLGCCV